MTIAICVLSNVYYLYFFVNKLPIAFVMFSSLLPAFFVVTSCQYRCFICQEPGEREPRRQADRMGQLHHEQSARYSTPLELGDDLCLRPFWKLRHMWRIRQYLLHIQVIILINANYTAAQLCCATLGTRQAVKIKMLIKHCPIVLCGNYNAKREFCR